MFYGCYWSKEERRKRKEGRGKRKEWKGKQSGGPRDAKTDEFERGDGRAAVAGRGAREVRGVAPGAAAEHAVRTRHRAKRVRRWTHRVVGASVPIIHPLPHVA